VTAECKHGQHKSHNRACQNGEVMILSCDGSIEGTISSTMSDI